jgi:hypothetical protein
MARENGNGNGFDARQALLDELLGKVEDDLYPSITMLDVIEQLLTPDDVDRYARILMAKIEDETYPSYELINRVKQFA